MITHATDGGGAGGAGKGTVVDDAAGAAVGPTAAEATAATGRGGAGKDNVIALTRRAWASALARSHSACSARVTRPCRSRVW